MGNTIAVLVEAGNRTGRRIVLVEQRVHSEEVTEEQGGDIAEDANDDGDEEGLSTRRPERSVQGRGEEAIWHEKLPILSGSVRRAGTDAEYGGRTVEVGIVLKRWFKFGRREW